MVLCFNNCWSTSLAGTIWAYTHTHTHTHEFMQMRKPCKYVSRDPSHHHHQLAFVLLNAYPRLKIVLELKIETLAISACSTKPLRQILSERGPHLTLTARQRWMEPLFAFQTDSESQADLSSGCPSNDKVLPNVWPVELDERWMNGAFICNWKTFPRRAPT